MRIRLFLLAIVIFLALTGCSNVTRVNRSGTAMLVVKGGDLFIQRYVIDIINTLPYSVLIHPTDEFFQVHDAPAFPRILPAMHL